MNKGDVVLTEKVRKRVFVMDQLIARQITNAQAAKSLGLSVRQIRRIKKEMLSSGIQALGHGNAGRRPKHALDPLAAARIIELAQTDLKDANCTHMAELMAERCHISVSPRTVQRTLKRAGILRSTKRAPRHTRMRERKPQLGILLQCDASPYDWLEGRGPAMSLHGVIDDATGAILGLYFRPQEDIMGYLHVFRQVLETYGIPLCLYSDRHTMFFSPKKDKLTIEEELQGKQVNLTQIGRILDELQITHIAAHSPQAKGRIERLWQTLQSRLPIEMRLARINTIEAANEFLVEYIPRYNTRFAVLPANEAPAFRPLTPDMDLDVILATRKHRQVLGGSVISCSGVKLRLVDAHGRIAGLKKGDPVYVLTHMDGSISALCRGQRYSLAEFSSTPVVEESAPAAATVPEPAKAPWKPLDSHPWKRASYERQQRIQQAREAAKSQNTQDACSPLAAP
jgi:transposase